MNARAPTFSPADMNARAHATAPLVSMQSRGTYLNTYVMTAVTFVQNDVEDAPPPELDTTEDPDASNEPFAYPPFDFEIDMPNPFTWCDMTDPFLNPFCPTYNPMFNILIKMMIPGAIRPVIDNWEQKMMTGQVRAFSRCAVTLSCMVRTCLAFMRG